jgi:hypothetical protein
MHKAESEGIGLLAVLFDLCADDGGWMCNLQMLGNI